MNEAGLSRRKLLIPLGVVGVGGALGIRFCWNPGSEKAGRAGGPWREVIDLASLGSQLGDLSYLGGAYLQRFPEERNRDALADVLGASLEAVGALEGAALKGSAGGAEGELRQRVLHAVAEDFAQGETFEIDGWILSRTEGRLAALTVVLGR